MPPVFQQHPPNHRGGCRFSFLRFVFLLLFWIVFHAVPLCDALVCRSILLFPLTQVQISRVPAGFFPCVMGCLRRLFVSRFRFPGFYSGDFSGVRFAGPVHGMRCNRPWSTVVLPLRKTVRFLSRDRRGHTLIFWLFVSGVFSFFGGFLFQPSLHELRTFVSITLFPGRVWSLAY